VTACQSTTATPSAASVAPARVIDFANPPGANRFLAVRELKLTGPTHPSYKRRADLVCIVNGLPLVFIVFSLIHRFNQDVDPKEPYSERDDIIVISDEAHRTRAAG
jgi:type I site-specific restriction-modification system R (restriction) subunit